ncbi:MAG: DUF5778 family protein [Halanaeroarchaeum sp.]
MTDAADPDLYDQAVSLLEPGDVSLEGVVVHTDIPREDEPAMNELTRDVGDLIAERVATPDTYLYAGEDDPRFSASQFQGRRLADDEFVWECQQLLRDGTFDVVFYWKRTDEHAAIVDAIADHGHDVVAVTEDGYGEPTE